MVAQSFAMKAGLKFEIIPYKGAAQSIIDVVANHIDFATPTVTSASGQLRGGTVTGLAVSAEQRLPDYPDVPTFRELGYDVVATNWFALAGPAGLPADIVRKVNREINIVMAKPESQQRMREDGMLVTGMDTARLPEIHRGRERALEAGDREGGPAREVRVRRVSSSGCEKSERRLRASSNSSASPV